MRGVCSRNENNILIRKNVSVPNTVPERTRLDLGRAMRNHRRRVSRNNNSGALGKQVFFFFSCTAPHRARAHLSATVDYLRMNNK